MNENTSQLAHENAKEIARLWESTKSAHHRISENDKMTAGIHNLAISVAEMATEVKSLTKRVDASLERIERGQTAQGARIGEIEQAILTIKRNEKTIEEHEKRLDVIEREPGKKWDKFTWLVIAGIATAIVTFFIGKLL